MKKIARDSLVMKDKFRGCLVGAILGDCLGSPFEGLSFGPIPRKVIENDVGLSSKTVIKGKKDSFQFTDDSAMARCICKSLLAKKQFDACDMVTAFLDEYKKDKCRGYGSGAMMLFERWDTEGYKTDPFLHSREQFSGSGSYGNGAAMRVAPVALFTQNEEDVIKLAKSTALLTHSHKHGYNGAILQAVAIHRVLFEDDEIHKLDFVRNLKETMKIMEESSEKVSSNVAKSSGKSESTLRSSRKSNFSFESQLVKMEGILRDEQQSIEFEPSTIVDLLGNDISAQESVPASIFTFISCSHLNFVESLTNAYTLGGDTDTIGTMVGALAGAHFGYTSIPQEWQRVCEGVQDAISFADQFYENMLSE